MKFVAFERAKQGTGASRRLRIAGRTPGIVYGASGQPQLVELDHNALWHALKKEAFHSSILEMELNGQTGPVLLRDVQYHPFKPLVLHVDFQRVDAKTRLSMKVPVHYVKADQSDAVKLDACVINTVVSELEVACFPGDLPEFIEVDLSGLKKGQSLHLDDISLPKGVTAVTHGKKNPALVTAVAPVEEAVIVAAPAAEPAKKDAKKKK